MMKPIFGSYMLFFGMAMFLSGCREPKDYAIQNELKPTTFAELIAMSAEDVERVDIGRLNLICAAEALKPETFDIEHCLEKLDKWAELSRKEEQRFRKSYERNPARYDNSYAKFKAINLVLTIKEDFKCRYQMELVRSGVMADIHSPAFFRNPYDVFIPGLLERRRGTCSSYPVLIAALGRRLGYPIYLKATAGHLFCVWDDGVETFNIDTNGEGVDTPSDEHYFKERLYGVSNLNKSQLYDERFMMPLNNWDSLGNFIETVGYCHEARGRMKDAIEYYNVARKFRPNAKNLGRLASRKVVPKELFDHVNEVIREAKERNMNM